MPTSSTITAPEPSELRTEALARRQRPDYPAGGFALAAGLWGGTHRTSAAAAAAIRREGFRLGRGESGHALQGEPIWGPGVYLSLDEATDQLWQREGDEQLVCSAMIGRVLVHDYGHVGINRNDKVAIVDAAAACTPPGVSSAFDERVEMSLPILPSWLTADRRVSVSADDECVRRFVMRSWSDSEVGRISKERGVRPGDLHGHLNARSRGIVNVLAQLGFAGLCVLEDQPTLDAGGNQLLVFDPHLVQIKDEQ